MLLELLGMSGCRRIIRRTSNQSVGFDVDIHSLPIRFQISATTEYYQRIFTFLNVTCINIIKSIDAKKGSGKSIVRCEIRDLAPTDSVYYRDGTVTATSRPPAFEESMTP